MSSNARFFPLVRWFANLPVGMKLLAGFMILVILGAFLGLLGLFDMSQINDRVESMYTQEVVVLAALDDAKSATYRIRGDALEHILATTDPTMRRLEGEITEQEERVYRRVEQYRQTRLRPEEEELLSTFVRHFQVYMQTVNNQIIPASAAGDKVYAQDLALGSAVEEFRKAREAINDLMNYNLERAQLRYQTSIANYRTTVYTVLSIILVLIAVGTGLSFWLARSITHPLNDIIGYFEQIALGNLDQQISVNRRDEIGRVLSALADTQSKLATSIARRERAEKEMRVSLAEKELLLKEVHHRVKNNLQVISSMLSLSSASILDWRAQDLFHQSRDRIKAIALIHAKLYQSSDLARIGIADYLRTLVANLVQSYGAPTSEVEVAVDVEEVIELGTDTAIPCGLIINELVANALKHAFPAGQKGRITLFMGRHDAETLELRVSDDGQGFPPDLDFRSTNTLGFQLVTTLVSQIEGNIELTTQEEGTTFTITFPERQTEDLTESSAPEVSETAAVVA